MSKRSVSDILCRQEAIEQVGASYIDKHAFVPPWDGVGFSDVVVREKGAEFVAGG